MKRNARNAPGASKESPADPEAPGVLPNRKKIGRIDPSRPLKGALHERFAQLVAIGKPDAEAYREAGFKGAHSNKRAAEIRTTQGMAERIAFIREETGRKFEIQKEDALRMCAALINGEHGAEPHHRIAAMGLVGKWCGWEKGTEAERDAAKALGGVSELIARIRARK